MTVNPSVSPASAKPVSPLLYPTLLIAGICVIIASLLGVVAMTGLLPQARMQPQSPPADVRRDGRENAPAAPAANPGQDTAKRQ